VSQEGPPPYPIATIRLQFNAAFRFQDAIRLIPYFKRLGISHIYASPVLLARSGSPHGYDIIDHTELNPEVGGSEGFEELVETLHRYGMGLIMDFVPNHMGIGAADNEWWLDVLEWGPSSPYARFFDIDWTPYEQSLKGKVLLPFLGSQYGTALENGELVFRFDEHNGSFSVWYYEHRFPIAVRHYASLLQDVSRLANTEEEREDVEQELRDLARWASRLGKGSKQPRRQALEHAEARDLKAALAELYRRSPGVAEAVKALEERYNGTPGEPESFDELHRLLERQAYRLSYWRVASNEINYRRFFDINDLAGLRMEDQELFDITHQLIFRLIHEGKIQGIRLDHVDGLYNPAHYFERLQNRAAYAVFQHTEHNAGNGSAQLTRARIDQPLYLLVEKILAHHEQLRQDWQVSGTTGYEFMNLVGEVLTDPESEQALTDVYEEFCPDASSFSDTLLRAKYRVMHDVLASELNVLSNRFNRLAKQSRLTRDFSRIGLRNALTDVVAHFPVYRTYATEAGVSDEDRRDIDWAVARAKKYSRTADTSVYDFIHDVLTTDLLNNRIGGKRRREYRKQDVVQLAMSVQQFTSPVMAKSLEDTTFYRYGRFIARNEVGGDPTRLYASPQAFHLENKHRLESRPFCMLTTATHDHKRGEDVRARLNVISETPQRWRQFVFRLAELAGNLRSDEDDATVPSRQDEYVLYQTIVGTWPFDLEGPEWEGIDAYRARIVNYMIKAVREAKVHTSWTAVNAEYENGLTRFIEALLSPRRSKVILREIEAFTKGVMPAGAVNSLAQKLLALTSPGMPDVYQGSEFWDLSLVDPDNRREVPFDRHWKSLEEERSPQSILEEWPSGEVKQYLVRSVLGYRASNPDLFAAGSYEALTSSGHHQHRVLGFCRRLNDSMCVTVTPRLVLPLLPDTSSSERSLAESSLIPQGWEDTRVTLPGDDWSGNERFRDLLSGAQVGVEPDGSIPVADLIRDFPVAFLVKE
jgi:(1->4)-alpha-D-glucan 1-alpha-D-glucosylmutase